MLHRPPALSQLHHVVCGVTPREQSTFFANLGALRPAVKESNVPIISFAAFRELSIALSYPGAFHGVLSDMPLADEEFGRR